MATFVRAIEIAAAAHARQKDLAGQPYIFHPMRVASKMETDDARIAAVLHDVVEDSDRTVQILRLEGFSEAVCNAVDALSKRVGESYDDYLDRVAANPLATDVKLYDLLDNMDAARLPTRMRSSRAVQHRIDKYKAAFKRLVDARFHTPGDSE